jgi:predicted DNA-binding protein
MKKNQTLKTATFRLPQETIDLVKKYAVTFGRKQYAIVNEAIIEFMEKRR